MKRKFILGLTLAVAITTGGVARAEHHGSKHMWEKCDTDKDGFITKDEFMKSKTEHFSKSDTNSDGKLSKEEHEAMVKEMKEKLDD